MTTSFAELGLPARLVEALAADGITEAFPVQAITLPDALAGKDLCGRAPTGSGKTLGFGIPMMVRISQAEPTKPTGLVLVPTRELAEQVQRAFVPLGRAQWRFIQAIYGGASFGPQIHSLRKGASVVVATPGRLIDIIEKGYCDLSAVEVCVIDEADRMADLGFMPDVRKILDMTPNTRQTMLWSATLDGDVNELIRDYMKDPVRHDLLADVEQAPVDHKFVVTRPTERLDAAVALIEEHGPSIVFVKTRFGVDDVSEDLNRAGVKAGALHGARSQAVRQRVLEDFKRGKLQALVATDVAARGIHVDNVSLVLHYDMPDNDKDYTHRSGRTGRAGNAGVVIAFVPPSRQRLARQMSDAVGADVMWEQGETPIERVPAHERETGNRDRGARESRGGYGDRDRSTGGYRGSNDRPSYGRPNNDRPNNDRPSYDRPSYDRPSYDRPSYDRPNNDRPSYADRDRSSGGYRGKADRPSHDRPASDRTTYGDRPGYGDRPNYGDRDRQTAGYRGNNDRPSTGRPSTDRPSYGSDRSGGYRGNNDSSARSPRGGEDRGHNNWTPRTPRSDGPPRDRNDWSPRPRRDDDRGASSGRYNRDDRPAYGAPRGDRNDRPSTGYRGPNDTRQSAQGDRPGYGRDSQRPTTSRGSGTDRPWRANDDRRPTGPSNTGSKRPGGNGSGGNGSGSNGSGSNGSGSNGSGSNRADAGRSGVKHEGFATSGPKRTTGKPGGFRPAPSGKRATDG